MSQSLPVNDFKWVDSCDITEEGKGYILEVDRDYPKELILFIHITL